MINGNPNDFVDRIYSCQDTIFIYNKIKYWFQGYMPTSTSVYMEVFQYKPSNDKCIWQYTGKSITECYQEFLKAPIFDGKTFWEAESEIEWVDD